MRLVLIILFVCNCIVGDAQFFSYYAKKNNTSSYVPSIYDNVNMYILLSTGQSNALGQTGSGSVDVLTGLPSGWEAPQNNIKIWWEGDYASHDTSIGTFENMNPVENTRYYIYTNPENAYHNQVGWALEQKSSHLIRDLHQKNVYVLKSSDGSMTIGNWVSNEATRWVELKRYILRAIQYADENNLNPIFLPIAWMQGESDILTHPSLTTTYQSNLRTVVSKIRAIHPLVDSIDIIFFKIPSYSWGYAGTPYINAAYDTISADTYGCYAIETYDCIDDYAIGTVVGHYGAISHLKLGQRWYDKIVALGYLPEKQTPLAYPTPVYASPVMDSISWTNLRDAEIDENNSLVISATAGGGVSSVPVSDTGVIFQTKVSVTLSESVFLAFGLKNSQTLVASSSQLDYSFYLYNHVYTRVSSDIKSAKIYQQDDLIRIRLADGNIYFEISHDNNITWFEIAHYEYAAATRYVQVISVSGARKLYDGMIL